MPRTRTICPLLLTLSFACYVGVDPPAAGGSDSSGTSGGDGTGTGTGASAGESGEDEDMTTGETDEPVPFEPVSPLAAAAKAKMLTTGLPLASAEAAAVQDDFGALRSLLEQWMEQPEFEARLLDWFATAFQQDGHGWERLEEQFGSFAYLHSTTRFALAVQEVFPRTATDLVMRGRSFNEVATTRTYMLTPALMAALAAQDEWEEDASSGLPSVGMHPALEAWVLTADEVPLEEATDPSHPNFGRFTVPNDPCGQDRTFTPDAFVGHGHPVLVYWLGGAMAPEGSGCSFHKFAEHPYLTEEDWTAWRRVEVRQPTAGETPTPSWDLATMRSTSELVLHNPRVGFFSTPSFFATWPTNESNQSRVSLNQTLIVALGRSINPEDLTVPISDAGLDAEHAEDTSTVCYACHKTLDPMRRVFQGVYDSSYRRQLDPTLAGVSGEFAFEGVAVPGIDLEGLGDTLAAHPLFAPSWVQKACFWANAVPCDEDDPEFERVLREFVDSGHDFKVLLATLLSSPLTTFQEQTLTSMSQPRQVAAARASELCAAWETRLGLGPVCSDLELSALLSAIPRDGFARSEESPVVVPDPTLLTLAATEALCAELSHRVVGQHFSPDSPQHAVQTMVATVLGMPQEDPRHLEATAILGAHFDDVLAAANDLGDADAATTALRSTFQVACASDGATTIGL